MPSPERRQRVMTLYQHALELDAAQRRADSSSNADPIRGYAKKSSRCSPPPGRLAISTCRRRLTEAETRRLPTAPVRERERIGPYRVLRRLGHGGMGTVFLAERADEQFHKQVAIKLIRRGMDDDDTRRRFLYERQILASLSHPNIAQLLDGGVDDQGRPYLVMEYVEGLAIDAYCDRHRLSTRERLEIFRSVCSAVHYAHQNLVVHRDLKPSNIMLTSDGSVKLLDFGIAKLLNPALSPARGVTQTGMQLMTPEYASPEQVRGDPLTTTSDVYSLGVVLYELLTGRPPYQLRGPLARDLERMVLEEQPERPSTAVTRVVLPQEGSRVTREITPEQVSRLRDTEPGSLRRSLKGDLDNIVLKAMRKEPQRRYASAEQLAEDLRRHLVGLPVSATGDGLPYRARKFVRRHRFGVATTSIAIVLAIATAVFHTARVTRERDRARAAAAQAEQVSSFLVDLFAVSDPTIALGRQVSVREILDQGRVRLQSELDDQPQVKARLLDLVGNVYLKLALYDSARPLIERALELRRAQFPHGSVELAESLHSKGELLRQLGEYDAAERLFREALDMNRGLLGEASPEVATSLDQIATCFENQGRYHEAEPLFRQALDLRRSAFGERHTLVATSLNNLGLLYQELGDYGRAEQLLREALALNRELQGENHPDTAYQFQGLGHLYSDQERWPDAIRAYGRALEIRRAGLGDAHPLTLSTMLPLGKALFEARRFEEAEQLLQEARAHLLEAPEGRRDHQGLERAETLLDELSRAREQP